MTNHSQYAFVLALLAGVGFLAVETAEAENSRLNVGQIAPPTQRLKAMKVKPKMQPSQALQHLNVPGVAARGRPNLGNVPARLRLDPGKLNRQFLPADQPALVIPKPRVTKHKPRVPKLNQAKIGKVPLGQAASGLGRGPRNSGPGAAGVQDKPALPPVSTPPFNQDLVDAITVTGGAPDWWKAFENWSDLINAGPGNFQPEFMPGGGRKGPEIDLTPFGPDRLGESGEQGDRPEINVDPSGSDRPGESGPHGVGPRGWPGSAQGNAPFGDPSGKASDGWVVIGSGDNVSVDTDGDGRDDATFSWARWSNGGTTWDMTTTVRDDGRRTTTDTFRDDSGNTDVYIDWYSGAGGTGKHVHTRNGEPVNDVELDAPIVITAGEDTGEDEDEKGSGNPEDSQPGAEGTGRPRGGARDVDCDWWGCVDGGVSTPAQTNPGHADNDGSITVGGSIGPGAVTDPTPMDDTTGSGGGYSDPGPGGDPGDPDGTP
jgi:hypothetical protein